MMVEGVRADEHMSLGGLDRRRDLYLRERILKSMRCLILSQCRDLGTGEM